MSYFTNRLARSLKKAKLYGAGICGTSVITAYLMYWTNKERKDNEDKNNIFDLEEIVKKKAWAMYKPDQESKNDGVQNRKEPVLQIVWDGVKCYPEKPDFTESSIVPKQEGAFRVILQAVVQNKSIIEQRQTLKAGVETLTLCECSLTKGYTKGSEVGLSLQAPDEVANAANPFLEGFSIKHVTGNSEKKQRSLELVELITIPRKSQVKVSKGIKETQREFDFEAMIAFEGNVEGTFYNQNNESIVSYVIPITTIIDEIPKEMTADKNGRCCIKINGSCTFKYEIEQEAEICVQNV